MVILLLAATLWEIKPGPIDAYRANLSAARADVQFQCDFYPYGSFDYSVFRERLEKLDPGPGPAEKPPYIARGRWGYDGSCEHYVLRITGGTDYNPNLTTGPAPSSEVLWDGDTYAYQYLGSTSGSTRFHVEIHKVKPPLIVVGPFTWKNIYRFDQELDADFKGVQPTRKTRERWGRVLEVEVYQTTFMKYEHRREIAYDPAIGYVPRFVRGITYGRDDKGVSSASVAEVYVIDARPCAAGGFVPVEWYLVGYHIDDFDRKNPDYSDASRLTPSDMPHLVHFKVLEMGDQKGPVTLTEADGYAEIVAPGGFLQAKGGLPRMSLVQMTKLLGKRMIPPPTIPPAPVDSAELHEFDNPQRRIPWLTIAIIGLAIVGFAFLVRMRGRGATFLLLTSFAALPGCGSRPIPRLTAHFSPDSLIYDAMRPTIQSRLVVDNAGNRTLRIFSVGAGCSCRHIDGSQFPALLRPGDDCAFNMSMGGGVSDRPQDYMLTFETDCGQLTAVATLLALPDHQLRPQSVVLSTIYEGEDASKAASELVHREHFSDATRRRRATLEFPPEFIVQRRGSRRGQVSAAPNYSIEDTLYRLELKDTSFGVHRSEVRLHDNDGHVIVTAPIVWQKLPYISSVPERVALSSRPVRAFLRCPDERVELLRVLSAPRGVNAVLSSPREIMISPTEAAPEIIDGRVEVETTAAEHGSLCIPVVRYAPRTPPL